MQKCNFNNFDRLRKNENKMIVEIGCGYFAEVTYDAALRISKNKLESIEKKLTIVT